MRATLAIQAGGLSAGTMATLTGETSYPVLDAARAAFVAWCVTHQDAADTWQAAWALYQASSQGDALARLAEDLAAQAVATQTHLARERCTHALTTRLRPTVAQAEPVGLFAQTQGELFHA